MKTPVILSALLLTTAVNAQHYVRTKHNYGICATYNFIDNTVQPWSTKMVKPGTSFKAGICHSFSDVFFPEVYFTQHNGQFPLNGDEAAAPEKYKWTGVGAGMLMKVDLFSIDNKKKNGYCFGRVVNIDLGMDYTQALNLTHNNSAFIKRNELNAKAGLGMYSVWGGSAKNHETWTIHWEALYNYSLSPFMTQTNYADGAKYAHSSFSIGLRLMHYKTYKFSDM